ncbi:MAG: hypothetical protein ACRCT1_20170 [Microcoleaceae cyanobacterium]
MAIFSPENTSDFLLSFGESDGTTIKTIVDFAALKNSIQKPGLEILACACRISTIQIQFNLPSIREIAPPGFYPEDDSSEIAAKIKKSLELAPSKCIGLFKAQGTGQWIQIGQYDLQNHGAWSYRNADIDGLYGATTRIGAGILNSGSGSLQGEDKIILIGDAMFIPCLREIAIPLQGSQSYGYSVIAVSQQILPANNNRKGLYISSESKIWLSFGNPAIRGRGCFIAAGGTLSIDGEIALEGEGKFPRYLQSLAIHAIADSLSSPAIVSAVEFW